MVKLYQVAYGLFIALILVVVAILSLSGVAFTGYATAAKYYLIVAVLGGLYVISRVMFGDQPLDWSQGYWHAVVSATGKSVGAEQ